MEGGFAQAEVAVSDLRPEFSVREGSRPIVVRCSDEAAEGRFLAAEISALLKYKHYSPRISVSLPEIGILEGLLLKA